MGDRLTLSRISELEAIADNLRRENAELRSQLESLTRKTSLLPPPIEDEVPAEALTGGR